MDTMLHSFCHKFSAESRVPGFSLLVLILTLVLEKKTHQHVYQVTILPPSTLIFFSGLGGDICGFGHKELCTQNWKCLFAVAAQRWARWGTEGRDGHGNAEATATLCWQPDELLAFLCSSIIFIRNSGFLFDSCSVPVLRLSEICRMTFKKKKENQTLF